MESESTFTHQSESATEKPLLLFHASPHGGITEFAPRSEKQRDESEGPRVFGTPDRTMALLFLVDTDDSWVASGRLSDVPFIVISDEARFRTLDAGGYLYTLPSDTFTTDQQKGLSDDEYTSIQPVQPLDQGFIPSALDAMLDAGVLVYFVDSETWRELQVAESEGRGEECLLSLTPVS